MSRHKRHWALRAFRALLFLFALMAVVLSLITLMPWKKWASELMISLLHEQGVENAQLEVEHISFDRMKIANITLGTTSYLSLQDLEIHYRPEDLLKGHLKNLTIEKLRIEVIQTQTGWRIKGLNRLIPVQSEDQTVSFSSVITQIMQDLP